MKNANRSAALAVAAAAVVLFAGGCAPLVVGGAAVGGALVATDRRSVGIQVEDEAIDRSHPPEKVEAKTVK